MKILLADDDEISRKIIASFLARFGYESLVVQNGAEAWEILQTPAAPPLAICDWMMPRMTGPEVCARLRAIKQPVRTYVILLSSRNTKLDIVKGLDAGADDYIVKPCDLTELQARLRVALRSLKYEEQLRKTIAEYDALIRRHTMLGEMAGHQVAAQPASTVTVASAPAAVAPPAPAPDLGALLCEAIREIGLGQAQLDSNPEPAGPADFSVVLPAYVKRDAEWVDLRLDITRGGAHALCRTVLRRPANSEHELLGVLAEAVHLLLGARSLARAKQALGLVPVLPPVAARSDALPKPAAAPAQRFALKLADLTIHAAKFATPAVVKHKSLPQLQVGDLVVDAARASGEAEHVLLSAGEIITPHRLGMLAELPAAQAQSLTIATVEAPEASRAYLRLDA
ncbi:MAG: response regulator receiver [Limisphaerales bacterium]|nr:MAG: response regulator receiver [Limisphaerales bacterium]KAG0510289.1 MAG: response regulator receiver [Limisphaerales bacterium]TXT51829.1 MAG: response regulator receiver [Limisphaerales bacterium]